MKTACTATLDSVPKQTLSPLSGPCNTKAKVFEAAEVTQWQYLGIQGQHTKRRFRLGDFCAKSDMKAVECCAAVKKVLQGQDIVKSSFLKRLFSVVALM
jgi:hypothetical protein